jgi:beta-lactamase regulating signal transducer with metallopeptidase domain
MMSGGVMLLATQADSARAAVSVYTATLLATLPLVAAVIAALVLRQARAEARALVWRCVVVAIAMIVIGRESPAHAVAWALPATLATPLVALGRVQVASTPAMSHAAHAAESIGAAGLVVRALAIVYVAGFIAVLVPMLAAWIAVWRQSRQAHPLADDAWDATLADACRALSIRRAVRLLVAHDARVPMTWGIARPVIVLPGAALAWSDDRRRMVLMHELSHVRSADWAFKLVARALCAVFWFHPGMWWLARQLRDDCERACDDRVLAAGAKRSDYAELLVLTADDLHGCSAALALSSTTGLRGRLAALLDGRHHDIRPLARGWVAGAAVLTIATAGPTSTVRLAPTRDVLTTLMSDARWESRAYAVLGLAQRADSVAVARSAAERDPSPRVRAWARYALGQADTPVDAPILLQDR